MRDRFLLAVAVLAVLLVGCLGDGDDELAEQSDSTDALQEAGSGNLAQLHRAGDTSQAPVDPEEVLGEVPVPVGLGRGVPAPLFEPTIGATSDGTLFLSNIEGSPLSEAQQNPPPDTEYSAILRSSDQGLTWEDATGSVGPVSVPPDTFDPYVYVDEDTDRVYNIDMIGLQCNWVRWSDDLGDSWISNPLGCGQPPTLQDHPTFFSGPPGPASLPTDEMAVEQGPYENVVYVCANRVVAEAACARSLDGGLTWSPWIEFVTGQQAQDDSCASGLTGHGTTGPDGTVYLPAAIGYPSGCGGAADPIVAISEDSGLTWQTSILSNQVPTISHEVALAVDEKGTVFAFWISDDLQPYLAHSTDAGESWSQPVHVGAPNVSITSHPTIAAGANGSVAIAYVGTEDAPEDESAPTYDEVPEDASWNAYLATVLDATQAQPVVATTTTNDPANPIGLGECGGTRCRAADGAGIGDFIDVTIDADGRPWAAFVDVCLETCQQEQAPQRTEGIGLIGTLAEGPSLHDATKALASLEAAGNVESGRAS